MIGASLRLFFHGLIAFAPNQPIDQGFDVMTAYLVKEDHHYPSLSFQMNDHSICPTEEKGELKCKPESTQDKWCVCKLGGNTKITFTQHMVQPNHRLDPKPDNRLPSAFQTASIEWLVRMASIHETSAIPIQATTGLVSAEISFGWTKAYSCHLDQKPNLGDPDCPGPDCVYTLYSFDFFHQRAVSNHRQALGEYATFETHFPFGPVNVVLSNSSGKITLELGCGPQSCPDLLIANPTEMPGDDQDIGHHFEAYYRLAPEGLIKFLPRRSEAGRSTRERPLHSCQDDPIRRRKQEVQRRQVNVLDKVNYESSFFDRFDHSLPRAVDTRIICPMTMFDPPR